MRQQTKLVVGLCLAVAGVALLFAPLFWLPWKESVVAEEEHLARLAQVLGEHTEQLIVAAIGPIVG